MLRNASSPGEDADSFKAITILLDSTLTRGYSSIFKYLKTLQMNKDVLPMHHWERTNQIQGFLKYTIKTNFWKYLFDKELWERESSTQGFTPRMIGPSQSQKASAASWLAKARVPGSSVAAFPGAPAQRRANRVAETPTSTVMGCPHSKQQLNSYQPLKHLV